MMFYQLLSYGLISFLHNIAKEEDIPCIKSTYTETGMYDILMRNPLINQELVFKDFLNNYDKR